LASVSLPIINVSQVKQLSPFRYPGGKTWFYPYFQVWARWTLATKAKLKPHLIELFAGGASVGLNALSSGLVSRLTLIELDRDVAIFWKVAFSEKAPLLAKRVASFDLTPKNVESILTSDSNDDLDVAFRVLLKNRISYGGIISKGAGRIKRGENNRGLGSRWYPDTLAKRIQYLYTLRSRVVVVNGDALSYLHEHLSDPVLLFVDPPYTASKKSPGRRLYNHTEVDHKKLLYLLSISSGEFLATYDDADEILQLANTYALDFLRVPMLSRRSVKMNELVLCRDASWVKENTTTLFL